MIVTFNDTHDTHRNTSLVREKLNIPCQRRQAQFPPPLTWMNRVQQACLFPIHCLANMIVLFNFYRDLHYINRIYIHYIFTKYI